MNISETAISSFINYSKTNLQWGGLFSGNTLKIKLMFRQLVYQGYNFFFLPPELQSINPHLKIKKQKSSPFIFINSNISHFAYEQHKGIKRTIFVMHCLCLHLIQSLSIKRHQQPVCPSSLANFGAVIYPLMFSGG